MEMNECKYHPGKMYWLENEEREFNNLVHYTNSFIVSYHDNEYPNKIFWKKFNNGVACVKWATKLNENSQRIGLHRFYLSTTPLEYIKSYETEHDPDKEFVEVLGRGKDKQPRTRRTKEEMMLADKCLVGIEPNVYQMLNLAYPTKKKLEDYINELIRKDILERLGWNK